MLKFIIRCIVIYVLNIIFCLMHLLKNRTKIISPLQLDGKKNIFIGQHVYVGYRAWLAAMPLTGENAKLVIDDGTVIGHFAHIYATESIHIGKKVLIADRVYISDNLHGCENITQAIIDQPILQKRIVSIGEDSWIGENVCIIGASVGKHCVIGANAVVTKDIPDYCVAVGSPAKVIKRYNFENKTWERYE